LSQKLSSNGYINIITHDSHHFLISLSISRCAYWGVFTSWVVH